MKKYIYGTVLIAILTSVAIFFFRPPETTNRPLQTILMITFRFPEGYEFTEGAPFLLTWQTEDPEGKLSVTVPEENFNPLVSPYKLAFSSNPNSTAVVLNARLYYCHKISRMCFLGDFKARVPLIAGSTSPISYIWDITPEPTPFVKNSQ
ncbi:MAG: hypothetical protein WC530_10095 [Candidatus Omnitrophota bacterium]|jgi:hypothetical protein